MNDDQIQSVVDEVIRDRLQPVQIVSVHTVRDEDFEGDDIIRVTVVVDSPASAFDPARLSSLVRFLRPRLAEISEKSFPLISFMSKAEAKALAL
ncbi:hypothetical protein [Lichenihabitans psoromatis]|uniref:hypothetical protein n=1 Tax=Lichenihabitans psoromatis TaxID=2528642 RepID=UPI00103845F7|nr:hypothetical protein [Lichenihabitans psoromatis]